MEVWGNASQAESGIQSFQRLFEFSDEAMVVLTIDDLKITKANTASGRLFHTPPDQLTGEGLERFLSADSDQNLQPLLQNLCEGAGRKATVTSGDRPLVLSALPLAETLYGSVLLRLLPTADETRHFDDVLACATLKEMVMKLPDAFVAIDEMGKVLMANEMFTELVAAASEAQVRFLSIDRWIGLTEADGQTLIANAQIGGAILGYPTVLWTETGEREEIQVSVIPALTGSLRYFGLLIRSQPAA